MTDPTKSEAENAGLLPCPFCGGKDIYYHKPSGRGVGAAVVRYETVECKKCLAGFKNSTGAVGHWNRRASIATPAVPDGKILVDEKLFKALRMAATGLKHFYLLCD